MLSSVYGDVTSESVLVEAYCQLLMRRWSRFVASDSNGHKNANKVPSVCPNQIDFLKAE